MDFRVSPGQRPQSPDERLVLRRSHTLIADHSRISLAIEEETKPLLLCSAMAPLVH
jgi:hypothetical protein